MFFGVALCVSRIEKQTRLRLGGRPMAVQVTYPGCFLMPEIENSQSLRWPPVCHITYTRDAWVKLFQSPSEFADREAKLLCQDTPGTWIAWVPNYGEVVLDRSQFYC